ncbi:MAG TPA: polysaccharide biosynthesis/export family protein [Verrucomicrobiae bacterium]|nr:polysaccharide biosynthesis/export family protein [Verrucomicrobiae bacterium]
MSDEYTHFGTVRRRPRAGHQRSQSAYESNGNHNGKAHGNGAAEANGSARSEFERETYYDGANDLDDDEERAQETEPNPRPRSRARHRMEDEPPRKALPHATRELDLEPPLFRFPFDPWRLYGAAKRHLLTIFFGGVALAIVGFFLGALLIDYRITIPLIRKTPNAVHTEGALPNVFNPHEYSDGTLYGFIKYGPVLQRVSEKAAKDPVLAPLRITPWDLSKAVSVTPSPNPDWIFLSVRNMGNLRALPALANLYANEAVEYMREIQQTDAKDVNAWLRKQIVEEEKTIASLEQEVKKFSTSGFVGLDREMDQDVNELTRQQENLRAKQLRSDILGVQIASLAKSLPDTRLDQARLDLANLLIPYSEGHPLVIAKRHEIAELEKQKREAKGVPGATSPLPLKGAELQAEKEGLEREIADVTKTVANIEKRLNAETGLGGQFQVKKAELDSHKKARDTEVDKERESRLFVENSLGYFGIPNEVTAANIGYKSRWIKVSLMAVVAGIIGLFVSLAIVLLTEMLDTTLRTPEDIKRVANLPVLATLGDLRKMNAAAQVEWAFRTLTKLKGKLSRGGDQSLVCGIISANHGEGRSTWVNLLVSAASQRGLRVLTVDTRPPAASAGDDLPKEKEEASKSAEIKPRPSQGTQPAQTTTLRADAPAETQIAQGNLSDPSTTLGGNVLSAPAKVAEQLEAPNAQPVVHIPLPGWAWNLERRKQWQKALEHWKKIEDLVIFIELPPACESEAILLAEHLPQVIWLAGSGMADSADTIKHLETLRNARCKLVGAVLNHAPPPFISGRFTRWFGRAAAVALLGAALQLVSSSAAQNNPPGSELRMAVAKPDEAEPLAFSANAKHKRAQWQERLTLGPGDIVDIHIYSNTVFGPFSRTNVFIGPDGRINYLYASGIPAVGLTIDELRQKIADALARYYNDVPPAVVVVPVSYSSKKYFMLGKVNAKGAYTLDRPLTLVEAVARAKGLETGLYQRTTVEMADLGHSFLIRNGQKAPIDFEKLFLEGDLSQNALVEPNDYIYFASTAANDIYVLGEVVSPGPIGFLPNATVVTAITDRGGFDERAYKRRVLVVRGSLNEPETFVVDTGGVLDARVKDFKLQPRDIVYVGHRPWIYAEDILDEAAGAFIEGAMTAWAGASFSPIITTRLLPKLR